VDYIFFSSITFDVPVLSSPGFWRVSSFKVPFSPFEILSKSSSNSGFPATVIIFWSFARSIFTFLLVCTLHANIILYLCLSQSYKIISSTHSTFSNSTSPKTSCPSGRSGEQTFEEVCFSLKYTQARSNCHF
jgi:hypothetical protein